MVHNKRYSFGHLYSGVSAMTSLNNPVNLPLDTNGYVKSSIWGQNINPNVNTVASVTGAVGSVTNPVTSWITISHQTGLSAVVSSADAPVNIGSAISITKDGKIQISLKGHVSGGTGFIDFTLTRNAVIYYYVNGTTSSHLSNSGWISSQNPGAVNFSNTSTSTLVPLQYWSLVGFQSESDILVISVLNGDSIQFRASNGSTPETTYIDDLVVQQQ